MVFLSTPSYSSLSSSDLLLEAGKLDRVHFRKTRLLELAKQGVRGLLLVVAGTFIGLTLSTTGMECVSTAEASWSVELPDMVRTATRFNGSFEFEGRYRGEPSPEIDYEWNRFTEHHLIDGTASLIAVNEDDIKRANKTSNDDWFNTTVEYGAVNGGGYMATLELFHQLHCLNMLRKAIHSDYYTEMQRQPNGSYSRILITHLDHCVEILRQVLSCHADTGLITFHWVQGNNVPYPDFNTWHQCKDPEQLLKWSKAREAPIRSSVTKQLFSSIVEMPHAP